MIRAIFRLLAVACCLAVAALAFLLWDATGRAGYTRYPDPARAASDKKAAEQSLGDLFEGSGLNEGSGRLATIPNDFALGLAPSGPGKHAVSLATIAGPALAAGLYILLPTRRAKPTPPTAPPKPG